MFQRRGGIDIRQHMRFGLKFGFGQASGNSRHFHTIIDTATAKRIGMHRFIRQRQHIIKTIQMPDRGVNIYRFNRISGNKMQTVKILVQSDQVLKIRTCSHAPPMIQITNIRRRSHRRINHILAANGQHPVSIAWRYGKLRWRPMYHFHDQRPIHTDILIGKINVTSGFGQNIKRFFVQENNTYVF